MKLSTFHLPAILILAFSVFSNVCCRAEERPPNVVVIMADDLGYTDLGCYGCKDIPTPHIDSLARDGARFTSAYVTASMCGPSRAGFLTGRNQNTIGYYSNVKEVLDPAQGLPKMETIASLIQKQGYVTGGIGKWHMGTTDEQHPNSMGFTYWYGFLGGGHTYFPIDHPSYGDEFTNPKRPANTRTVQHILPMMENRQPVDWDGYMTTVLTDKGVEFIEKNKAEPFFLFMSYNAPHEEMEAPEKTIAKFAPDSMTTIPGVEPEVRSIYAAMVVEMDDGVGRLLATLDEFDLSENTVVWFLSDHGGMKKTSDNRPLQGAKGTSFEGGIRVPFMVRWPGKVKPGTVLNEPVTSLDLGATSLALAGGNPAEAGLHGVDISKYMTSQTEEAPNGALFWRTGGYARPSGMMREGDFKLMIGKGKPQLFNLKDDIGESTNVAKAHRERVKKMLSKWKEWDKSSKPPLWGKPTKDQAAQYQYSDYEWLKGSPLYRAKAE